MRVLEELRSVNMDNEKTKLTTEHHEHQGERRRFDDHGSGSTAHGDESSENTLGQGNVPEVDTKYASEIQVSKLKGTWLSIMVRLSGNVNRDQADVTRSL